MNNTDLRVNVCFNFSLSLWQAIKLRIAGKNFKPIAEEVLKSMVSKIGQTSDK